MRLPDLLPLARDTVSDPRAGFRALRTMGLDRAELWQALIAVAAISVILAWIGGWLAEMHGAESAVRYLPGPLATGLVEAGMLSVIAVVIYWGGTMLGGRGSFDDALLAVVWLQFILNLLHVVQLVCLAVIPVLAELIGLAGVILTFWLLTGFVAELHGFRSMGRTLAGILIAMFGLAMAFVVVLLLIGIGLPETANV